MMLTEGEGLMSKRILVALSLAALTSASAFAATFEEVDANQDGMISAEEAQAAGIDVTTADANQDGALDQSEFEAAMGGHSQ
jgi:Ca2+-binding EF-hand superfamily protein